MNRFRSLARAAAFAVSTSLVLSACGGGGHHKTTPAPIPVVSPTAAPSSSPVASASAYTCSPDGAVPAAVRRSAVALRRMPMRGAAPGASSASATRLIAVNYAATAIGGQRAQFAARESAAGASFSREISFGHLGTVARILSVPAAQADAAQASLRQQPGVRSVGITGLPRRTTSVSAPFFTSDPFFAGVSGTSAPLFETAATDGQWDMHVMRLEYAFAYSQVGNGSAVTNPSALGSSSVKVAVIDTGADMTHPELSSKIVYQKCYLTNSSGAQSTSNFVTDQDGHGTNVAGIAAAASDNAIGFTGAGGNVELYDYRVFPTPDDNCSASQTPTDANDPVCSASGIDIADAIEDAIQNRVNVINLSLGGGTCASGKDPDSTEGAAVADALAANIVVVASSGNLASGGTSHAIVAPACDSGVLAVGATSLADGSANGSQKSGGSPSSPSEYVPSYSFYGSPAAQPNNGSAWGIVAPGGDGSGADDTDDLHWIENIWTSTPYDTNFEGSCFPDSSGSSTTDCRTFIAGTSQASPHVAGAAALILSVNSAYQSTSAMKQLLCSTADDIGDPNEGCGRIDIYRAMATAVHDSLVPGPQPIP